MALATVGMFESKGLQIDDIFFSHDTWIETGTGGHIYKQNNRKYFWVGVKKKNVIQEIEQEKAQRHLGKKKLKQEKCDAKGCTRKS